MDPAMDDKDPSADEQFAFTQAHRLIEMLMAEQGCSALHISRGVFIAAISTLRKVMAETDLAKLFYEYADDYATRQSDT